MSLEFRAYLPIEVLVQRANCICCCDQGYVRGTFGSGDNAVATEIVKQMMWTFAYTGTALCWEPDGCPLSNGVLLHHSSVCVLLSMNLRKNG